MDKKRITILFLADAFSIHTLKWVSFFARQGHKVCLVSYSEPVGNNDLLKDIDLRILKRKFRIKVWPFNTLLNLPGDLREIKKIIKEIKPDILHAHYLTSYGHLAVLSGFKPFIATAWGSDVLIAPRESLKAKMVVKKVLKSADLITTDAGHMKEAMIKLGADGNKIKIVNFGIDTKRFCPGEKSEAVILKFGFSRNYPIILSLRSLEPLYDIESIIKAMIVVLKTIPEARLIIARKDSLYEALNNMVKELNLSGSVKFAGWISKEELPDYLRTADVYVSTSLSDAGISGSTAEAMSCELPVVISNTGENGKWVDDGKNGMLIPIKSPDKLAEKIIYLLRNESARKNMAAAGRKTILERNDYYREMGKMENLYITSLKK